MQSSNGHEQTESDKTTYKKFSIKVKNVVIFSCTMTEELFISDKIVLKHLHSYKMSKLRLSVQHVERTHGVLEQQTHGCSANHSVTLLCPKIFRTHFADAAASHFSWYKIGHWTLWDQQCIKLRAD